MWKIICASYDDDVRSQVEKLEQYNSFYRVKRVSNTDELCLAAVTESFDVYILDSSIEVLSVLCGVIRSADEDALIISLSENEADRHKALDAGANMFLKLPNELKLLPSKIDDLLDSAK